MSERFPITASDVEEFLAAVEAENACLREQLELAEQFIPGHQATMYATLKRERFGDAA